MSTVRGAPILGAPLLLSGCRPDEAQTAGCLDDLISPSRQQSEYVKQDCERQRLSAVPIPVEELNSTSSMLLNQALLTR